MSFLYFAYGSNLLPARLQARCPSAQVVGRAVAPGHRLAFSKPGRDGSGKATLQADPGAGTPGMLYRIALSDHAALHAAEGADHPNGYVFHEDFALQRPGAAGACTACTYIARRPQDALLPFDWYLALIIAGAQGHGLSGAYIGLLKSHLYVVDTDRNRAARQVALQAFSQAGIADFRSLLSGAPQAG